jgi:hypothetical protein
MVRPTTPHARVDVSHRRLICRSSEFFGDHLVKGFLGHPFEFLKAVSVDGELERAEALAGIHVLEHSPQACAQQNSGFRVWDLDCKPAVVLDWRGCKHCLRHANVNVDRPFVGLFCYRIDFKFDVYLVPARGDVSWYQGIPGWGYASTARCSTVLHKAGYHTYVDDDANRFHRVWTAVSFARIASCAVVRSSGTYA